ncbi:MAG TPA: NACHT domain-containing protein [Stenomitos sp.]
MTTERLQFDAVLAEIDAILLNAKQKPLKRSEVSVLQGAWGGLTYSEMAERSPYNTSNLQRKIAPQLWKRLSTAMGQEISKPRFRSTMESLLEEKGLELEVESNKKRFIGVAPSLTKFVGRVAEVNELSGHLTQARCIFVSGAQGIGKTALIAKVFEGQKSLNTFESYVWKYCISDDPKQDLLDLYRMLDLATKSDDNNIEFLRIQRNLIVLDGIDGWLTKYRPQTERLLKVWIEGDHQSCLLITARESLTLVDRLIQGGRPVKKLLLEGLSLKDGRTLLKDHQVVGRPADELMDSYRGNPMLLLQACGKIALLGGDITTFMDSKTSMAVNAMAESLDALFFGQSSRISEEQRALLGNLARLTQTAPVALNQTLMNLCQLSSDRFASMLNAIEMLQSLSLVKVTQANREVSIEVPKPIRKYISTHISDFSQIGN